MQKEAVKENQDTALTTFGSIGESMKSVWPEAEKYLEDGMDRFSSLVDSATTTVKKYPMQSLFAGVGIGCLLGLFLRGRK